MGNKSTDRVRIDVNPVSPLQLRGRISNLRKKRCSRDFMFTQADSNRAGKLSVLAALMGDSASASALGLASVDTTAEKADFVEFDLEDKYVKAWIWLCPFKEGDEVEVVAEQEGDFWYGYGIRRPSDRLVGLYPHCSNGRYAHFKTSAKWILIGGGIMSLAYLLFCFFAF